MIMIKKLFDKKRLHEIIMIHKIEVKIIKFLLKIKKYIYLLLFNLI